MPASLYKTLFDAYGDPRWWPARTPFEVMVGAVLTQNTAWGNVERAIANFGDALSPEIIDTMPTERLIDLIRPAGFFNQKAAYLKALVEWFKSYDYSFNAVRSLPLDTVRHELLSVRGIGRETADSILLYAFGFPTFVVDAYTLRLLSRLGVEVEQKYEPVRKLFMDALPQDAAVYNICHALIVVHCKAHCKAKPVCEGCPTLCNFSLEKTSTP